MNRYFKSIIRFQPVFEKKLPFKNLMKKNCEGSKGLKPRALKPVKKNWLSVKSVY